MDAGTEPRASASEPSSDAWHLRLVQSSVIAGLKSWFTPARRSAAVWIAATCALALLQGEALLANVRSTLDPLQINNDAQQQIFPFYRYLGSLAFRADYVAEYYLACYPLGYWALYAGPAALGVDPTVISRALPHVLWLGTVVGIAIVAHELGGKLAALCAVALALGSNAYLSRIGGGLPRSFGFPILALALAGLARARVWWCVASVILGALFYPVAGVISGLSLAAATLLPARWKCQVAPWGFRKRLLVLAGTGVVSVLLLLPSAVASQRFGAPVRPWEIAEFPEAGPGGRYSEESRPPFKGFFESIPRAVDPAWIGGAPAWSGSEAREWLVGSNPRRPRESVNYRVISKLLFVLVLAAAAQLLLRKPAARRIALLGAASGVGHTVACQVAPYAYLPERYVVYSMALLGTVFLSVSITQLLPPPLREGRWRWPRRLLTGAYAAGVLWLLGGRVAPRAGLGIELRPNQPLFEHIASLPEEAAIAAWPNGVANAIPHASRRRVLLTHEVHQAFHRDYIAEMRRRMNGLIDAYFATSPDAIVRLRDELGVTHLLIERAHFGRKPPRYFKPFDRRIDRARKRARGKSYELPRQIASASVFSFQGYELLDLSRLAAAPQNK